MKTEIERVVLLVFLPRDRVRSCSTLCWFRWIVVRETVPIDTSDVPDSLINRPRTPKTLCRPREKSRRIAMSEKVRQKREKASRPLKHKCGENEDRQRGGRDVSFVIPVGPLQHARYVPTSRYNLLWLFDALLLEIIALSQCDGREGDRANHTRVRDIDHYSVMTRGSTHRAIFCFGIVIVNYAASTF